VRIAVIGGGYVGLVSGVVDLRNVYGLEAMTQAGFYYVGVGRRGAA
jgi:hypothetical protein